MRFVYYSRFSVANVLLTCSCCVSWLRRCDAVAALGAAHVGEAGYGREVGYDRADRVELVPAHDRATAGQVDVVENDLRYAHEHLLVHFAVVAPHGHLQHSVLVVGLEPQRLLVLRVECASLSRCLLLLGARVALEQVELHVDVYFFE